VAFECINEAPWSLGQTAILSFADGHASRQRLPIGAIFARGGESRVFRVTDGRLEVVPVTVRRVDAGHALIESNLPAGALVVIAGVNRLHDGQAVRARRGDEVAAGAGEAAP